MASLITLFVDNLAQRVDNSLLRRKFSDYGVVKDAFIPMKRGINSGRRFGFVRFDCPVAANIAVEKANGIRLLDNFISVKHLAFNRYGLPSNNSGVRFNHGVSANNPSLRFETTTAVEKKNSYADAVTGRNQSQKSGGKHEMELDKKDVNLDQNVDDVKKASVDLKDNNDVVDAYSEMGWPCVALEQNQSPTACHLKDYGDCNRPLEEENIQGSSKNSKTSQNKSNAGKQDNLEKGVEEDINSSKRSSLVPETQDSSGRKVVDKENDLEIGDSLEEIEHNRNEIYEECFEDNCNPIQADMKGLKPSFLVSVPQCVAGFDGLQSISTSFLFVGFV
ncbi:hypothetical protein Vadar_002612 [Vaccinium darrowii]|uniref:Uncharacterized protein n=1 Tax=Vaccinium darrowii TaxID=229202 RepID=A0ACB7XXR3_9ERIC|nr:hypothetical protein Vadar_002612 [Vaccinium darrowii]